MRLITTLALAAALAACSQPDVAPSDAPAVEAPASETIGGDGSALELQTLSGVTLPELSGELGCAFTANDDVLLLAKGNVDRAARSEALIRRGDTVEQLMATDEGGYDGMVEGARFGTRGLVIEVATQQRNETRNEQVAYNATLRAMRADGAERTYQGDWTCGP